MKLKLDWDRTLLRNLVCSETTLCFMTYQGEWGLYIPTDRPLVLLRIPFDPPVYSGTQMPGRPLEADFYHEDWQKVQDIVALYRSC